MEKLRSTQQFVTPTILKMPSINEISFPKMKSRLKLQQIKLFKNEKSSRLKKTDEQQQRDDKLVRSYSMSLMTIKKDLKNIHSLKKKRSNINPENIICINGQKGQNFGFGTRSPESMKPIQFQSELQKSSKIPANEQVNVQNNLTEGYGNSSNISMCNSLYPGVKLESAQYAERRTQFLKRFLPGLENVPSETSLTARLPKKKHMFNSKFQGNKKPKDQLPDELVTRKLIWDGRQAKKIDHNLIYRDIVKNSKNQKQHKLQVVNLENQQDKIIEFMRLSAWEFHDDQKLPKDPLIQTSRN